MWNKDEIKGKGKQIKGAIKNKVGEVTNDPNLEAEGEAERREGKVQEKVGRAIAREEVLVAQSEDVPGCLTNTRWQLGTKTGWFSLGNFPH